MKKKIIYLFNVLLLAGLAVSAFTGCAKRNNSRPDPREIYLYTEKFSAPEEENYGYSVDIEFKEENTKIQISTDNSIAVEIPVPGGRQYAEMLFLDMNDNMTGFILLKGNPAMGHMEKTLYITTDGWNTHEAVDISSQIKTYPRHFAMLSDEIGYIGGDRRDGSTLYRTLDGGRTWSEVGIGENTRNAFAPIEGESGKYYELIEIMTDEPGKSAYNLYESDDGLEWERLKNFLIDATVSEYYYADGRIYFVCGDDTVYAMDM